MLNFRNQNEDYSALADTAGFLNYVMKKKHFSAEYLKWQYVDNPLGKAIAISAFEGDNIVGHYSAQPIISKISGVETQGLFILNAAVDPANQGKGLLRGIADRLHEEAAKKGFLFMIGVGNKNSTPIYTKKFGFRSLGSMDVKIGFGLPESEIIQDYFYERIWDEETLKWRISNPDCSYRITKKRGKAVIYRQNYPFMSTIMGMFDQPVLNDCDSRKPYYCLNLFLGFNPAIDWTKNNAFFNFPEVAKPSPLVVIFRELSGEQIKVTKSNMLLRGIDFDAF